MNTVRSLTVFRFATVLLSGFCILWVAGCKGNESREAAVRGEGATMATSPAPGTRTSAAATRVPVGAAARAPASSDHSATSSLSANRPSTATLGAETTAADIPSTAPRLILSGRVTLAKDGSPAAGAMVELVRFDFSDRAKPRRIVAGRARVDDSGQYRLVVRDDPYFLIQVHRKGAGVVADQLEDRNALGRGKPQSRTRRIRKDFVLPVASVLAGRVVDDKDQPVKGITVTASTKIAIGVTSMEVFLPGTETTTDGRGVFRFGEVKPGDVGLSIDSDDYVPLSEVVTAPAEDVVLRLESKGGAIGGRVYLKSTGAGIAGAEVTLAETPKSPRFPFRRFIFKTATDAAGAFRFDLLDGGEYRIRVRKDSLIPVPSKNPQPPAIQLQTGEEKLDLEYFLFPGYTIHGKVTVKGSGKPLEGVLVGPDWRLAPGKMAATSGPDGEYTITGIGLSQLTLSARKKGYTVCFDNPNMPYIPVQFTEEKMEVVQNIEMIPSAMISGIVRTESGVPVPNAEITALSNNALMHAPKTATDGNGAYQIGAEPFTTARIEAVARGYPVGVSDPVEVENGPVSGVDVVLQSPVTVSGIVVGPGGKPLPNVNITVHLTLPMGSMQSSARAGSAVTDGSGSFFVENLPAGELEVIAKKEGFTQSAEVKVTVKPGEVRSGVKLVLAGSHFLAGHVTDVDGKPLEGIGVFASSRAAPLSDGMADTDANGRYRMEGLANVPYSVSLNSGKLGVEFFNNIEVDREDADFVMGEQAKATLIGHVIDVSTGQPIKDFMVSMTNAPSQPIASDPSVPGRFTVKHLLPGFSYPLEITAPGYADFSGGVVVLPRDRDTLEKDFPLGRGGTITGRVVARATKKPLARVRVLLRGTGTGGMMGNRPPVAVVTTAADGRFRFSRVGAGSNRIDFVPGPPLVEDSKTVEVKDGETAAMGDVELGGGSSIRGRVVKTSNDAGVPNLHVNLARENMPDPAPRETTTDASGVFLFHGVSEGSWSISVPEEHLSVRIQVGPDETKEVVVRIGGAALSGRVLKGGKPCKALINLAEEKSGLMKIVSADAEGRYSVNGLEAGHYSINVYNYANTAEQIYDQITLKAGETLEKDFHFPDGRIVGRLVDAAGKPVEGGAVKAISTGGKIDRGTTSGLDGTFRIPNLPAETYTVTASKKGLGEARQDGVAVPEDGESEPVELHIDSTHTDR